MVFDILDKVTPLKKNRAYQESEGYLGMSGIDRRGLQTSQKRSSANIDDSTLRTKGGYSNKKDIKNRLKLNNLDQLLKKTSHFRQPGGEGSPEKSIEEKNVVI